MNVVLTDLFCTDSGVTHPNAEKPIQTGDIDSNLSLTCEKPTTSSYISVKASGDKLQLPVKSEGIHKHFISH